MPGSGQRPFGHRSTGLAVQAQGGLQSMEFGDTQGATVKASLIEFGLVEIDGHRYDHDIVVERGHVGRRHKKKSQPLRGRYGHTPLSLLEPIPWACHQLIVGTGADGALPIEEAVVAEAGRRGVELIAVPTDEACVLLSAADVDDTAAILHVTC